MRANCTLAFSGAELVRRSIGSGIIKSAADRLISARQSMFIRQTFLPKVKRQSRTVAVVTNLALLNDVSAKELEVAAVAGLEKGVGSVP
jgi:hypothetical protein